ncbi:MAG TPA: NUDIX domain-containing protein [Pseudonocardia sp.]|uniref:NUDIX hydrolase n=1 Tax=Pseudonocardia sp. TaxID=60912 RepID=UPI002B4ADFB1|nr:NUDIX domain-containing protein [Pseudonocardia sp.]HLU53894.1 NUDIX domain-containing protein [Pseudonocardia sp.]
MGEPLVDPACRPGARVAARVLLLDPAQRLLLFEGFDPHVPDETFWFTAGGGLEPGEELRAGARRELREETGLLLPADRLVGPVWLRRVRFTFEGVEYDSDEWFFVAALTDVADVDTAGFTELEARTVRGHRWWSAEELAATTETVYPLQLAELLPGLVADGWDGRLRTID